MTILRRSCVLGIAVLALVSSSGGEPYWEPPAYEFVAVDMQGKSSRISLFTVQVGTNGYQTWDGTPVGVRNAISYNADAVDAVAIDDSRPLVVATGVRSEPVRVSSYHLHTGEPVITLLKSRQIGLTGDVFALARLTGPNVALVGRDQSGQLVLTTWTLAADGSFLARA